MYRNHLDDLFASQKEIVAKQKRSAGLDIVRTVACLSVIGCHFFLHTPFNSAPFEGVSMFLQGMLTIVIGSDLYMILTGYLCSNKIFGSKFYKGGIKVIASYIFFSILTIVANIYFFRNGTTWFHGLKGILSFSTIPYAWYIEMWIGLFLLAPFLNIWYKALPNKRMKIYLIAILFALSALPDILNRYGMYIVPQYWNNVYPLAFYFFGCYVKEYRPHFSRSIMLTIVVAISMVGSIFTMIVSYPTFLHITGSRSGIFMATIACLLFLTFYDFDIKNNWARNLFKQISLRSLDIFLCSSIFDAYIYPLFKGLYFESQAQFGIYYFVIIPLIFIGCYIVASIKRLLFRVLDTVFMFFGSNVPLQSRG